MCYFELMLHTALILSRFTLDLLSALEKICLKCTIQLFFICKIFFSHVSTTKTNTATMCKISIIQGVS